MLVVVEKVYFGAKADASLAAVTADAAASDALVVAVSLCPLAVDADAADSAALVLLVDAEAALAVALEALAVALEALAVAEVAAAAAEVVAEAASTSKLHFAASVFVVSGWLPLEVCATVAMKILFVEVSLTISRIA